MYPDEALLPLSALQHLLFCPRQCGLIHLEGLWAENRLTVEGQQLHRKAHEGADERRGRTWIVRGLPLRSERLGLVGKADVVEFQPPPQGDLTEIAAAGLFRSLRHDPAGWRITPVEYKRGKPKADDTDRVQLCAQALCLEEMLGVAIEAGALFYGRNRRRTDVAFDEPLRATTAETAARLHALIASGQTPPARRERKCQSCSLVELCLPAAFDRAAGAAAYTRRQLADHLASEAPAADPFDELP